MIICYKSDYYENDTYEILSPESAHPAFTSGYLSGSLFCYSRFYWNLRVRADRKRKSIMPVKGYFQRARVFGYLVLVISLAIIIFYLFEYFTD